MLKFKEWLEAVTDTQAVYLGGQRRALNNDNSIRYNPLSATVPSHKFSDEVIPDEVMPWIMAMHQRGNTPEQLSVKLWKQKKVKASPETIRNKINVEKTRDEIVPTLRKNKLGDIEQKPKPSFWEIPEEIKEIVNYYKRLGMPASLIGKKLKSKGINVSFQALLNYLHTI